MTGGVEESESPRQAAAREVEEETGFLVGPEEARPLGTPLAIRLEGPFRRFYPGHDEITEHRFHLEVPLRAPRLQPREHDDHRWCDVREALGLLYWPSNRDALRALHGLLEGGDGGVGGEGGSSPVIGRGD